jgi:putative FmdB family regulatory protein
MPIYEYRCTKCGCVFEEICSYSANGHATHKCAKCGHTAKRLISAPQVVFHGGGFYVTDHKSANPACDTPSAPLPDAPPLPAPAGEKKGQGKDKGKKAS